MRSWAAPLLFGLFACTTKAKDPPPTQEQPPALELDHAVIPNAPIVEPPPPIDPAACASSDPAAVEIELVRQLEAPLPERFDPSGRFAASSSGSGCDVWALDSGRYVGRFGEEVARPWPNGEDPCATWLERLELDLDGSEPLRSVSPDQARVALATEHAIELRELDTDTLLATLSLAEPTPPGGEVQALVLFWSEGMPVALIGREPCPNPDEECEWDSFPEDQPVWELRRWANPDAQVVAELVTWEDGEFPAWIYEASADPLGRWLWISTDWDGLHDSPWERRQIPLTKAAAELGASFHESGMDGEPDPGVHDFLGVCGDASVHGRWFSGARTARVWSFEDSHYMEGSGSDDLSWASFQLWPKPVRSGPHQVASSHSVLEQKLEVLGIADAQGVVLWSHCWPDWDRESVLENNHVDDLGDDVCRGNRLVPTGCEARGTSDALDWLLVACGLDWRLLPLGPSAAPREPVELASIDDGAITAVYGRSGLALAGSTSGLRLLGSDGKLRASFPAVTELLPATLGPELDRVVGRTASGLEVFNLESGERIASLAVEPGAAIEHLAFAPDGQRLASSDGRHIAIHEFGSASATHRWDAGPVLGLAWRQDGAVLFSGTEKPLPERAWDPATGTLASIQPDPAFVRRLAEADLDPSWRWAFEGDDIILRTLDGLALHFVNDRWVTESGLYDAAPAAFVRIIGDAEILVIELASLPRCLRHPNLLEHFVAGVTLPSPRIDPTSFGR